MRNLLRFLLLGMLLPLSLLVVQAQSFDRAAMHSVLEQHKNQKLSHVLADLAGTSLPYASYSNASGAFIRSDKDLIQQDGMVKIIARADGDANTLLSDLTQLGGQKCVVSKGFVCGWVPIASLADAAQLSSLTFMAGENKPQSNVGAVTSEGDVSMNTDNARKFFNVNGAGVKVGILSDAYNSLGGEAAGIASGDLPGAGNPNGFTKDVVVLDELNGTNIDEGRAMAEIIHDVAPGSELFFASAFNGFFEFAENIRALRTAGCDVIVDDVFYFSEPYFQDGAIAQAVDDVVADGAVYFSSAGNGARESYESVYNNLFGAHAFAPGVNFQRITIPPGAVSRFWLQWDDPSILADLEGPVPDTDMDFLVFDTLGNLLAAFADDNAVSGTPIEAFSVGGGEDGFTFEVVIAKFSGPDPRRVKYVDFGDGVFFESFPTFSGTCLGHSNATGAIATGASAYFNTSEFITPTSSLAGRNLINSFSSQGGVPILVDKDGNDIPVPVIRDKPEMVGPDGGNTTFFSGDLGFDLDDFPNFFGTSASAPHIAALAALMLELKPSLTPAMIEQILKETALDMDDPSTPGFDVGFDFRTGFGFVQGDLALATLLDRPAVYRLEAINSTTDISLGTFHEGEIADLRLGRFVPRDYFDLAAIEGGDFNILAYTTEKEGFTNRRTKFFLDNSFFVKTEFDFDPPYSAFGDDNMGDFEGWTRPTTNPYSLTSYVEVKEEDPRNPQGVQSMFDFEVDYNVNIVAVAIVDPTTLDLLGFLESELDIDALGTTEVQFIPVLEIPLGASDVWAPRMDVTTRGGSFARRKATRFPEDAGFFTVSDDAISLVPGKHKISFLPIARAGTKNARGDQQEFAFRVVGGGATPHRLAQDLSVDVYPNPSRGTFEVSALLEADQEAIVRVFNIEGKEVFQSTMIGDTPVKIDLTNEVTGLYVVRLQTGETQVTRRIVVE